MTKEDKELLLRDLSARLPYNVKVLVSYYPEEDEDIQSEDVFVLNEIDTRCATNPFWIGGDQIKDHGFSNGTTSFAVCIDDEDIQFIKPYLRPMSSMTNEEWIEYCDACIEDEKSWVWAGKEYKFIPVTHREKFLNSHYFDYRGLIPMGLALEAEEGMYKIN